MYASPWKKIIEGKVYVYRSKWRDAQKTWDNTTDLPARPETLDDLLAPDIDVLIDCEIAPEHTQPATAAAADLPTPM
ncbi:Protein of unknown function [Gryllus bimaculatus]|nr:Protein of unknown function [Gryllus bimaculatus]